ncbi:HMA2 domain-containing protein [Malaciobacter marinus]|uniref:HMA2 domain-containing protein n=1 Tax=Malaciobacter marinus TaxID=505249 RepID=UPI003B004534
MILIKTEDIIKIASYFTIVAHSPGRLRVRVNPKIKNENSNISIEDIEQIPNKIKGIKNIKVNKVIASVTITYDANIFKPEVWEDLINKRNLEEITKIINNLAKEVM